MRGLSGGLGVRISALGVLDSGAVCAQGRLIQSDNTCHDAKDKSHSRPAIASHVHSSEKPASSIGWQLFAVCPQGHPKNALRRHYERAAATRCYVTSPQLLQPLTSSPAPARNPSCPGRSAGREIDHFWPFCLTARACFCGSASRYAFVTFSLIGGSSNEPAGHLNRWMYSLPGLVVQRQSVLALKAGLPFLSFFAWGPACPALRRRASAGAVDGLAVDLQPAAHGPQVVLAGLRNHALGGRADVQQVVAAFADDVHQLERQVFRRLPVVVVALVAPGSLSVAGTSQSSRTT